MPFNVLCKKKVLITGITGQDGLYLSEFLRSKDYEVHGVIRRSSRNDAHTDHCILHYGDLTDSTNLIRIIKEVEPDEIYNLGAQSQVKVSFDTPEYTANADGIGTLRILEAIRLLNLTHKTKFYQASSSEMFGQVQETPQTEKTPFYPRSPYGVAKLYSYWITVNYREAYNMFACNGILFNHESELRSETFVTRKITMAIARIANNLQEVLYLGNIDSKRDWGYAKDYIEAMWLMMQQDKASDYVIATGETHTVREFVERAFKEVGIEIEWQGSGLNTIGIDKKTLKTVVKIDPKYFRPTEVDKIIGNPAKALSQLGWKPKTTFNDLIKIMMAHDLALVCSHQKNLPNPLC